ncbi:MAG: hypothetical protein LBQ87_02295 [Candidatus Fibromonas sp.]|jgi:uncharacterized protein (TIGR02145 family)|nr:hypothetical protein [Candidatus Fibromonas sp.]
MMKTSRFLLAAGIMLALASTLSCSGDDGSDGTPGTNGEPGQNGTSCVPEDGGAYLVIKCGEQQTKLPKAMCGVYAYDPEEMVCRNNVLSFTFVDARDSETYKAVYIGEQIWMAENLNFIPSSNTGSKCYADDLANCVKYGRLYNWNTAMATTASSTAVPSGVQDICPAGWHLPSNAEWDVLIDFAGGVWTAGAELKTKRDWTGDRDSEENFDTYGFSALPGGLGEDGSFKFVGSYGYWWSSSESDSDEAILYYMGGDYKDARPYNYDKNTFVSVRCLKTESQ